MPPIMEDMSLDIMEAETWMLCAASLSPAPDTPMERAENSASLFSRPSPIPDTMSWKKGSLKKAFLLDNSSCFSGIVVLCIYAPLL